MRFGLTEEIIALINSVFGNHPEVETVLLYGSRAKGNFKNGSDIDLACQGREIDRSLLNRIAIELDDLLLPYSIDLCDYAAIEDPDVVEHIERVGKIFYKK